jgi:hypothetical protein
MLGFDLVSALDREKFGGDCCGSDALVEVFARGDVACDEILAAAKYSPRSPLEELSSVEPFDAST